MFVIFFLFLDCFEGIKVFFLGGGGRGSWKLRKLENIGFEGGSKSKFKVNN